MSIRGSCGKVMRSGIMSRYIVLLRFTEQGMATVRDSAARAEAFQKNVAQMNVRIEGQY